MSYIEQMSVLSHVLAGFFGVMLGIILFGAVPSKGAERLAFFGLFVVDVVALIYTNMLIFGAV